MSREEAIDIFDDNFTTINTHGHYTDEEVEQARQMAIKALEKEKADKTTDHPEWIDYEDGLWKYAKCPVCGSVRNTKTPFCPICGTKMKGVIGK